MTKVTEEGRKKYKESKRLIRKAMTESQLVLFVGAGASIASGMPSWSKAVNVIADRLGIESDKHDSLVIPQYYYVSHGEKAYTQLVHEIFRADQKLLPGEVHKKILDFNTETIITTNYDNLIETAAEKYRGFIYPVRQDRDLPYRKGGRELIKMHGDFILDNFVLREDDYLNYSKQFRLIENYVKSLIGMKTVLFIGYSFNDPDVKQIFSWVKDILGEDFQRAYMIIVGEVADRNREEYFRHFGINIMHTGELFGTLAKSPKEKTEHLLQALNYLLDDSDEKQTELVSALYDYLRPFGELNYTYTKYVIGALNHLRRNVSQGITLTLNPLNYIEISERKNPSDEEKELLEALKNEGKSSADYRIKLIYDVLDRSAIKGIQSYSYTEGRFRPSYWDFPHNRTVSEWEDAIFRFDFPKLKALKESNARILCDSRPELYLEQAYICAFLGDYLSSYFLLVHASDCFYARKDYAWYFISLWNRRNIASILLHGFGGSVDDESLNRIREDYKEMNLTRTLQSIPDLGNNHNQFLNDLLDFKFTSDLFHDVVSSYVRTGSEASDSRTLFTLDPAYEVLRRQVFDYYSYTLRNILIVDGFGEDNQIFELFVRGILSSVSTPDKTAPETHLGIPHNVHASSLDEKDIHIILRYTSFDEMKKLFPLFNIRTIEITDSALRYLKELAVNIGADCSLCGINFPDMFWRLTYFVAHIEFDSELAALMLDAVISQNPGDIRFDGRNSVHDFVLALIRRNYHENEDICKKALVLLKWILGTIIEDNVDFLNVGEDCVWDLASFCQKGGCHLEDERYIRGLLTENSARYLTAVYNDCTGEVKQIIRNYALSWKCPYSFSGCITYCNFVSFGILVENSVFESYVFDYAEKHKENLFRQENVLSGGSDIGMCLIELYLAGKIIDRTRLENLVSEETDGLGRWLVDFDGFDYTRFDLDWLVGCPPELLEKLTRDKNKKRAILKIFRDRTSAGDVDDKTNKVVVRYFLDDSE